MTDFSTHSAQEAYLELEELLDDYDRSSRAAEFAYCSTGFEDFDGTFEEYQDELNNASMDALKRLRAAMKQATKNVNLVSLIHANGGELSGWLDHYIKPDPPGGGAAAQSNPAPKPPDPR